MASTCCITWYLALGLLTVYLELMFLTINMLAPGICGMFTDNLPKCFNEDLGLGEDIMPIILTSANILFSVPQILPFLTRFEGFRKYKSFTQIFFRGDLMPDGPELWNKEFDYSCSVLWSMLFILAVPRFLLSLGSLMGIFMSEIKLLTPGFILLSTSVGSNGISFLFNLIKFCSIKPE